MRLLSNWPTLALGDILWPESGDSAELLSEGSRSDFTSISDSDLRFLDVEDLRFEAADLGFDLSSGDRDSSVGGVTSP